MSGDGDTDHPLAALPSPSAVTDLVDNTHDLIRNSLSESMATSLKTLSDLETQPSCNKIATASLIHSCSTLDGSVTPTDNDITRGVDFLVQEEINVYAARLAVCELSSAKAFVPHACKAFVPTATTTKKTSWAGYLTGGGASKPRPMYPEYDEITAQHLAQCLSALHTSPQAWTSFTSSKASALNICQAMRGEIERDHTIHLHKVLASTTDDVVNALFDSRQEWAEFQAGFTELASNLRNVHLELVQNDEQRLAAARRVWAEWQADFEQGLQDISTGLQNIRSDVQDAGDSIKTNNQRVNEAFQQTSAHVTELAVQHSQDMHTVSVEIVAAVDLIQYMQELIQQSVMQAVHNTTLILQIANSTASHVSGALTGMEGRLERMEGTANHVENKLEKSRETADHLDNQLASFLDVLNISWVGATEFIIGTGLAFIGYTVIFGLLSVGVWQRVMPFPGNICASLATGLTLAYASTVYLSPLDALRYAVGLLFPTEGTPASSSWPMLYVSIAATAILLVCCIHRLLAGQWLPYLRDRQALDSLEADAPGRRENAFRLPVNDPKRVAEMAERRAIRETGGSKIFEV